MPTVYDKDGKPQEASKESAVILCRSGHFTKEKPKDKIAK